MPFKNEILKRSTGTGIPKTLHRFFFFLKFYLKIYSYTSEVLIKHPTNVFLLYTWYKCQSLIKEKKISMKLFPTPRDSHNLLAEDFFVFAVCNQKTAGA